MGHVLESFVVQQLIAPSGWTDPDLRFWHDRDKDKVEVDLVITRNAKTWEIEIKASSIVGPFQQNVGVAIVSTLPAHLDFTLDFFFNLHRCQAGAQGMTEKFLENPGEDRDSAGEQELALRTRDLERRVEEGFLALQESESRFRQLFDEIPDACFLFDGHGRFLDGNKAVEKVTGYSKKELIGLSVFECGIFPPDAKEKAAGRIKTLTTAGRLEPTTYNLRHRDGSDLPVEVTSIPIILQGETVILSSARDQRFRKQAERALQESEEKYRRLFESETDAIMLFDAETRQFIDVNDAAMTSYGYTREEFLQLTHGDITAEPVAADNIIQENLNGNPPSSIRSRHRKKDGTVFPVEITGCSFPVKGRTTVCGVVRDITEREKQEHELMRTRRDLRHLTAELSMTALRERQRIAAELHDGICQMLSSSNIHLEALKQKGLPEKSEKSIDKVCRILEESLKQTRSLIFELSCPMLKELGLEAALEELCSCMSKEQSVQIEFFSECAIPRLPSELQTILYRSSRELLTNVVKHAKAENARLTVSDTTGRLCICIEDDGIGFEAGNAGTGFSPSGGFGLFNLSEYLQHAGCEILIDSAPGCGTRVTITLPLENLNE